MENQHIAYRRGTSVFWTVAERWETVSVRSIGRLLRLATPHSGRRQLRRLLAFC